MKNPPEWLADFQAENPREALVRIAGYSQSTEAWRKDPIEVVVGLANGDRLAGAVVGLKRSNNGDFVLLAQGEKDDVTLTYVQVESVVSLECRMSTRLREAMTPAEESTLSRGIAPTRLQLKRQIETANQELEKAGLRTRLDCFWDSVGDSPEENLGVQTLLEGLRLVLHRLAAEPVGKESLQTLSTILLHQRLEELGLQGSRNDGTITLVGNFKRPFRKGYEEDLQKELEAHL